MPLYMDQHDLRGVSPQALAAAHLCDLEHQARYGVRFVSYWHHERAESGFCLVEAPGPSVVEAVHLAAHGNVPNRVIEVDWESVEGFLGRVREPSPGLPWEDIAARTILCASAAESNGSNDLAGAALARHSKHLVSRETTARGGRPLGSPGMPAGPALGCFVSAAAAVECALALQGTLAPLASLYDGSPVRMRIGISVGEPVDGFFGLFGETVHLATLLCAGALPGTTLVSSHLYELEEIQEYQFKPLPDLVQGSRRIRKYRLEGRRPQPSLRKGLTGWAQSPGGVPRLSPRQIEILGLVARGKTNQEIARLLVVSESTVATHLRNIFERTGVANRAEAATFGYLHHLY